MPHFGGVTSLFDVVRPISGSAYSSAGMPVRFHVGRLRVGHLPDGISDKDWIAFARVVVLPRWSAKHSFDSAR